MALGNWSKRLIAAFGGSLGVPLIAQAEVPAEPPTQPPPEAAPPAAPLATSPGSVSGELGAKPGGELEGRFRRLLNRPGGLTADEVSNRAVSTSYRVKSKQQEVAQAAAEVDKALTRYFPELTLLGRYTRLSSITPSTLGPGEGSLAVDPTGQQGLLPAGTPLVGVPFSALSFPVILNQYYLQASVTVPLSDYLLRINHGHRAAEYSAEAAKLNHRAEKLNSATQAKLAYYQWVRARMQEVVAEQTLAQAKEHRQNAQLGFTNGRLSQVDVLGAESRVASAELLLAQARRMAATSQDLLRTQMHDAIGRSYEIGEDILGVRASSQSRESLEELRALALQKRLELQAIDKSLLALERSRRGATASAYPRLSAFGNAYYANPNPRIIPQQERWKATWDAGVQLVWVPNGVWVSQADTSGIDAQRARLEAERGALTDALYAQVMDAHQAVQEAEVSIASAERGLVAAEEAYRVRRLLFQHGRGTSLELTDAETALLRARLERIHARVNLLVAQVNQEHAVGRDVR
jgi:outer membrane protein